MKHKKIMIDLAVISLAFLLFIIWHRNFIDNKAQTTFSTIKFYEVYLITTDKEYQYWEYMNNGAADMAVATGVNYTWVAPVTRDVNKQIEIIKKAVSDGADAILLATDDPMMLSGVIEDAKASGVKVIYVDSPANEEAIITLASDNYEAGVLAGQTLLSLLDSNGITSGSIGIVSYASKVNTQLREKGFRETLANDSRFTVLETRNTVTGDPQASQEAAERIIDENKDLVAIFGTNEGSSVGVGNAIKANGNQYIGIGVDRTDVTMELLSEGSLKAIIEQNPYTMGYLGMAEAVAALLGKDTGPEYINTGISVVRDNQGR
jgi:ribose transport system substrate-binding protein